jgi:hypothetical protein
MRDEQQAAIVAILVIAITLSLTLAAILMGRP